MKLGINEDFAIVDLEAHERETQLAVFTGDAHIGRKISQRLGDAGIPVLVIGLDDGEYARRAAQAVMRSIADVPCEVEMEDTSKLPANQPWYNNMRPGGKKSHRGKRNRSGNHW